MAYYKVYLCGDCNGHTGGYFVGEYKVAPELGDEFVKVEEVTKEDFDAFNKRIEESKKIKSTLTVDTTSEEYLNNVDGY